MIPIDCKTANFSLHLLCTKIRCIRCTSLKYDIILSDRYSLMLLLDMCIHYVRYILTNYMPFSNSSGPQRITYLCAYTCTEYTLYSLQTFKEMRIPQIRDPSLPPLESLPESYQAKVTVYRVLHVAATAYSSALISRHIDIGTSHYTYNNRHFMTFFFLF